MDARYRNKKGSLQIANRVVLIIMDRVTLDPLMIIIAYWVVLYHSTRIVIMGLMAYFLLPVLIDRYIATSS